MQNNNYIPEDFIIRNNFITDLLLDILKSPYSSSMVFKWWTMMTLFLDSHRFSEDLDFNIYDTSKWLWISEWIYNYLLDLWYNLWELYTDWTNVYNIEVFYIVNWSKYTCQVEIFKDDFGIGTKSYQDFFLWIPINIMIIEQSFAHKCCAYIERWDKTIPKSGRPKWRDLFDILHYINLWVKIDLNIIKSRLWINNEESLFRLVYQTIAIKHFSKLNDFKLEIENFSYDKINWLYLIEELLNKINKIYLNNKIHYNLYIWDDIMNIDKLEKIIINQDYIVRIDEWSYKIFDLRSFKYIYDTKDIKKLNDKIKNLVNDLYFYN
jgi:hypothetical protein